MVVKSTRDEILEELKNQQDNETTSTLLLIDAESCQESSPKECPDLLLTIVELLKQGILTNVVPIGNVLGYKTAYFRLSLIIHLCKNISMFFIGFPNFYGEMYAGRSSGFRIETIIPRCHKNFVFGNKSNFTSDPEINVININKLNTS